MRLRIASSLMYYRKCTATLPSENCHTQLLFALLQIPQISDKMASALPIRSILAMDPREIALFSHVFHLPAEITITSVDPSPTQLVIGLACPPPPRDAPDGHPLPPPIHPTSPRTPS